MRRRVEKVMIIQPPMSLHPRVKRPPIEPPLGIGYLAAGLSDRFDVGVLDCYAEGYGNKETVELGFIRYGLGYDDIRDRIESFRPDVVCISSPFIPTGYNSHQLCRIVKSISRDIPTIMGGIYPSSCPGVAMKDGNLDYIVIGEGEETLLELIDCIDGGKDVFATRGVGYREDGRLKINDPRPYIYKLDELPFPARDKLPFDLYQKISAPCRPCRQMPFTNMITSRGCTSGCCFCSVHSIWGRRYRNRSVENVIEEMRHLISHWGIREIHFTDENMTLNKARAKRLFRRIIDEELGISWSAPNGIALWTLDIEMLELMARSGCHQLGLAIESGEQRVLNEIIRKPLDLKRTLPLIRAIKSMGIKTEGFFIIGFPGESKQDILRTIDLANELELDDVSIQILVPYPGTAIYGICKERGLIDEQISHDDPISFLRFHPFNCSISTKQFTSKWIDEIKEMDRFTAMVNKKGMSAMSVYLDLRDRRSGGNVKIVLLGLLNLLRMRLKRRNSSCSKIIIRAIEWMLSR
jgi:magnesium-protoporphyrin IX monomethyl ester (oxidative) cyclase